jgi:hypothetical protein
MTYKYRKYNHTGKNNKTVFLGRIKCCGKCAILLLWLKNLCNRDIAQ